MPRGNGGTVESGEADQLNCLTAPERNPGIPHGSGSGSGSGKVRKSGQNNSKYEALVYTYCNFASLHQSVELEAVDSRVLARDSARLPTALLHLATDKGGASVES